MRRLRGAMVRAKTALKALGEGNKVRAATIRRSRPGRWRRPLPSCKAFASRPHVANACGRTILASARIMKALRIYAGPAAREHITAHGLRAKDVRTIPGAAG